MVLHLWESRSLPIFLKPRSFDRGFFIISAMNKHITILFILSRLFFSSFSQEPDTAKIINALTINPVTGKLETVDIDTTLFNSRFYNPPFQNSISVTFLGNAGQPFLNNHTFDQIGFKPFLFHSGIDEYFHTPYNTFHYNTRKPFTEIRYMSSGARSNSEQVIRALHTQNITPNSNIGLNYDVIASKGIFIRQEALANRFTLFGSHNKDRYAIYASVNTNRIQNQENGGIADIDNFIEHPADDPLAYSVKLNDANSTARKYTFFALQSYGLGKSTKDSTRATINLLPAGAGINHTFNYSRYLRSYKDQITPSDTLNFYTHNYYLVNSAKDSAFMHLLENAVSISFRDKALKNIIMAGVKHQFQGFSYLSPENMTVSDGETDTDNIIGKSIIRNYNNISLTGNIALQISKFSAFINGEYFLAGYRANDIDANIIMNKIFGKKESLLSIGGNFQLYEPDFFIRNYRSSHFKWNNDFGKTFDARAFITLKSQNGTIYAKVSTGLLRNFIYFNDLAVPNLKKENLYIASFTLHKAFQWGGFNHHHDALMQVASDNEALRFPLFGYKNSTYYENAFFKKVLKIQLGFDFFYNTSYYSDGYMPALGIFYQQANGETGNYPYLNGFLNWKVKRTRFFLNYTNALAGIAGHNYFTAYGYPMNWESLKFGLAWTFYD